MIMSRKMKKTMVRCVVLGRQEEEDEQKNKKQINQRSPKIVSCLPFFGQSFDCQV